MTAPTHRPRGRPASAALRDLRNVLAAAQAGERYTAIADRYGVDRSTIGKIAQRHGVVRDRGRPRGSRVDDRTRAELRRLTTSGSGPRKPFTAAEARQILGLAP